MTPSDLSIASLIFFLVNNAGVYGFTPIADLEESEVRRQFETNGFGLLFARQEAGNNFSDQGGSIINMGSYATALNIPASIWRFVARSRKRRSGKLWFRLNRRPIW
jgi:NAD(P)-dependent dehydrogenase (short-subunit alcohol dehydrogenase family)